jgi:PAS domain S-box-containing protein
MPVDRAAPLEVLPSAPTPDSEVARLRAELDAALARERDRERLLLAAEATQDLVWDWDVAGGTVSWAGATCLYFDSPPAADRATWADRVHPDDLDRAETAARAAFATGARSWAHEYRFRRTDGSWATMLERASIVRDPDRRAIRAVGAMQDVSGQKLAEEATLRLAAIVASASDAIVGKTTDGIITSWNAAAERLFGYTQAEVLGHSVFMLVPPELHDVERDLLERVRRGERVDYSTTERLCRDGTRLAVSLTVSPIWDPSGHVVGVSSIQRDITDRQRATDELSRREQRYRALVQATTSIVWTTDPDGNFVEPQPGWEQYTGQLWEQHRGLGWIGALHPDDRERITEGWLSARRRASVYQVHGRLWHQGDQRYRRYVSRAVPVRGPDGAVREWIGTLTDVEEQQAAEEALRQADRLESVGRLAGGVAHEANNQMTVVLGATAFLQHRLRDPQAREDVEHIRRAAQRTAAITQQLLAFGRRQILQVETVDLNDVVRQVEPVLQRALGETSRLAIRLDPDLGTVKADWGQLDQVLLNLALNARDAMPEGGRLTIETGNAYLDDAYAADADVPAGQYVLIAVTDTGVGMDAEVMAKVFDPFFTTKAMGAGSGLGLSQVYGFVRQSGGHVKIYSEPGDGTTVKIYLPRLFGAAEQKAAAADSPAIPTGDGSVTVLVVEDDAGVRNHAIESLRELGYMVIAADGAETALALIEAHPEIGLLFTDVVMPGMNGRRLSEEAVRRKPSLKVLFTTGYTRNAIVHNGMLDPGVNLLGKPFTLDQLARKIFDTLRT